MVNDTTSVFGTYELDKCKNSLLKFAQARPATWLGRRMALWARKIVLVTSTQPVIDAEVKGLNYRFYMNDNVSERKFLFLPQFFDTFEFDLMEKRLKQGNTFIDVGANVGIYSMIAAEQVGESGKVISIEPNPFVIERLKYNLSINSFEDRIKIQQCGVSDAEGKFDLVMDKTNLGGSSIVIERSDEKISISCKLLSTIIEEQGIKKIDGLKIDIEGAEDKALIPFFNTVDKSLFPKFLILENYPDDWKEDLITFIESKGYTHLKTTRMNQVWEFKE